MFKNGILVNVKNLYSNEKQMFAQKPDLLKSVWEPSPYQLHPPFNLYYKSGRNTFHRNCALAFGVAERELGIPALLDVEDLVQVSRSLDHFTIAWIYLDFTSKHFNIVLPSPDKFSVMTYLAQFYHKFTEQDPDSGFSSQVQAFIKIIFFTKLVNIFRYAFIAVFNSMHSVKRLV